MESYRYISDPQTREVAALFAYIDTDGDGRIEVAQAVALCRKLGFNIDKGSIDARAAERAAKMRGSVALRDVLGWCEAFLEACTSDAELRRTQMFMLLQGNGLARDVSAETLHRYLTSERIQCTLEQVEALVEEMDAMAPAAVTKSGGAADASRRSVGLAMFGTAGSQPAPSIEGAPEGAAALSEAAFRAFMRKNMAGAAT